MPNTREKLIELLQDSVYENVELDDGYVGYDVNYDNIANYLIANGVTVNEWISVKDRLPEEWHTVLVFFPSIDAIIPAKLRGGSWYATWDTTRLEYVSYWMPMPEKPQPPKGE